MSALLKRSVTIAAPPRSGDHLFPSVFISPLDVDSALRCYLLRRALFLMDFSQFQDRWEGEETLSTAEVREVTDSAKCLSVRQAALLILRTLDPGAHSTK